MGNSLYLGEKFLGGTVIDDGSIDKNRTWSSTKILEEVNGTKVERFEDGYIDNAGVLKQEDSNVKSILNTMTSDFIRIPDSAKKLFAYSIATVDADLKSKDQSNSSWLAVCFYDNQKQMVLRITPQAGDAETAYKYGAKHLTYYADDIPSNARYIRLSWRNWKDGETRISFSDTVTVLANLINYAYNTDKTFANVFNYDDMEFGYLSSSNSITKPSSGVELTNRKAYTSKEFRVTGSSLLVEYVYYAKETMNTEEWKTDTPMDSGGVQNWCVWIALKENKVVNNGRPPLDVAVSGANPSKITSFMDENGLIRRQVILPLPEGTKYVRFSWRTYGINPVDKKGSAEANACYGLDIKVKSSQIALLSDIK